MHNTHMLSHSVELRMLRKQKGLTQAELASIAGVSQSLVARIEKGSVDPRVSTLNSLFSALGRVAHSLSSIMSSPVIYATPDEHVLSVINKMEKFNISQLPVIGSAKQVGAVLDSLLVKKMTSMPPGKIASLTAAQVMRKPLPEIELGADIGVVTRLLSKEPAVIVKSEGILVGIVTRADLLRMIK